MPEQRLERSTPRVVVTKPSVPALWIDTSVLLKVWKTRNGERLEDADTYTELDSAITAAVQAGRLLCIESHQRDEFSGGRGEWEVLDTFRSLSAGVRLRHWIDVWNAQLEAAMRAYLAQRDVIELGLDVFFERDPVAPTAEPRRFLIDVRFPEPPELIELRRSGIGQTHEAWENLRERLVAEGVTYEKQLEREHTGYLRGSLHLVNEYFRALANGTATLANWAGAEPLPHEISVWRELGGQDAEFATFLNSQFHAALPIRRIESQLCAHLVTGNDRIKRSDSTDVYHLGLVVPVSAFVIADVAMEGRLKLLKIDQEWGTEVFSVRTIDALFARVRAL